MLGTNDTAAENAATSLLYAGEYYDSDLSQYYLRARYYNPWSGTFNRMDDFAGNNSDPQSLHKYLYCHNNPVNAIDPSGNMGISTIGFIAIAAILLIVATGCVTSSKKKLVKFSKTRDVWNGSTKEVEFRFTVEKGGNPRDFCLVNFRKGFVKSISTGVYALVKHFGKYVPADFPD